jgi:hypothetical protein
MKLQELRQDDKNANKGTARGHEAVKASLESTVRAVPSLSIATEKL